MIHTALSRYDWFNVGNAINFLLLLPCIVNTFWTCMYTARAVGWNNSRLARPPQPTANRKGTYLLGRNSKRTLGNCKEEQLTMSPGNVCRQAKIEYVGPRLSTYCGPELHSPLPPEVHRGNRHRKIKQPQHMGMLMALLKGWHIR